MPLLKASSGDWKISKILKIIESGDVSEIRKMIPWQVFISSTHNAVCGGSIISRKWILTSARCVYVGRVQLEIIQILLADF